MKNIIILGAGMAGFGAAHQLRENSFESIIFEKLSYYGGMTSSFTKDGFTFDSGPHISFTKDKKIQDLFADSVKNEFFTLQEVQVNNYWKNHWIKHPAQVNLNNLPVDLVVTILQEFIENKTKTPETIRTFKEWLYASFGKTFAETFPMKYGLKFHTTPAENMSIDWLGPRLYEPKLKEVLYGALSSKTEDVHYVSHFRYPKHGGFVSYLNSFRERSKVNLNHELINLDPNQKKAKFVNGKIYSYDYLISSIPLPELVPLIEGVPKKVLEASKKLACSTVIIVNIGVNRSDISKNVWTYFYDEDIIFTRLTFPYMQSKNNVPDGCGSIQAEIYFSSKYKPLEKEPEEFIERTIIDLKKCGLLKNNDDVVYKEAKIYPYANVIFDHERKNNLKIVHSYLDKIGIKYCGRYGEWKYIWTDQAFKSGMNAADKIIVEIKNKNK